MTTTTTADDASHPIQEGHQPLQLVTFGEVVQIVRQLAVLADHVNLGQDIDGRQLQPEHGGGGKQRGADELGRVGAVMGVDEVDHAQPQVEVLGQAGQYVLDAGAVRVQLDLTGEIYEKVRGGLDAGLD